MIMVTKKTPETRSYVGHKNRNFSVKKEDPKDVSRRLMVAVRGLVCTLRREKHQLGMTLAQIYERHPTIEKEWIDSIVFYRVLVMIEFSQSELGHMKDMINLTEDGIQSIAHQIGFPVNKNQLMHMTQDSNVYSNFYAAGRDE